MKLQKLLLLFVLANLVLTSCKSKSEIQGELKTWHRIALVFDGPHSSETGDPNPFTDYRLEATFVNDGKEYIVPGHFAADGKAAFTSGAEGNKWRVYFCPDAPGEWKYEISFKKGEGVAISNEEGESAGFMDEFTGTFTVESTDKAGRDLQSKGKLRYVGEHYLQFAGSGEYFLKCGADAPENLLAYYEFDSTTNVGDRLKTWEAHARDYNPDADKYLWGGNKTKGKNILGAINYLSGKGMNAVSFLTFNIDGDDRNVFPHHLKIPQEEYEKLAGEKDNTNLWDSVVIHDRLDVSKLDQWEQVFSYAEMKGMFLHFKTQETENEGKMDGGDLGPDRKLYYRELISRFGHHLAMNWNLGEENRQSSAQQKAMAAYFSKHDPYKSPIVIHTYPHEHEKVYRPLLGDQSELHGVSIQTKNTDFSLVHDAVKKWRTESANSGKKWVVAVDEPGDAQHALLPDEENPNHDNARINGLWGAFLAGGYGTEWYFGYKHAHSDLTCEDWHSRDKFWEQGKIALDFFHDNQIPVVEMQSMDSLTVAEDDFVFAKPGEIYLVYSKNGNPVELNLPDTGFQIKWFNPQTGEYIEQAKVETELVKLECPSKRDWLLYLYK